MLKNYFTVAIRNLIRDKAYVFINTLGLAVGLASCLLIGLFIYNEYMVDRFHTKSDRVYRLVKEIQSGNQRTVTPVTSGAFQRVLQEDFPEVEATTRCLNLSGDIQYKEQSALATYVLVEPDFMDIFDVPLLRGTTESIFQQPMSIVLSKKLAAQLFGGVDPIDKTVKVTGVSYFVGDLVVRGVMADVAESSSLKYEMLITGLTGQRIHQNEIWDGWTPTRNWPRVFNFILLKPDTDVDVFESKLRDTIPEYLGNEISKTHTYHLQPLTRIYLYSKTDFNVNRMVAENTELTGDIRDILMLGAVAGFILLIACINFMNLATARSARRVREVGLRKVVGANRIELIGQFLGEAFLTVGIALILALGLIEIAKPYFASLMGKMDLSLASLSLTQSAIWLMGVLIAVGLIAGTYPAFFLSAFRPVDALKNVSSKGVRGRWLRKGLVVIQFALSVALIAGTIVVYQQMALIHTKRLADEYPILTTDFFRIERAPKPNRATWLQNRYPVIKQELLKHPNVLAVTASQWPVGFNAVPLLHGTSTFLADGRRIEDGIISAWQVDEDFISFHGLELVAGRDFSVDVQTDSQQAFILNESAVKMLGWDKPIGKLVSWNNRTGQVIGVVKDYHYSSLHFSIEPQVLALGQRASDYCTIKLHTENLSETLAFVKQTLNEFAGRPVPAMYRFEDESIATFYSREIRVSKMIAMFSGLAIFLASLGLLGLVAYAVEQRTKEIGIRKILGASVSDVMVILSKDFAELVLVANLIAWPVAYLTMARWLHEFAYRVDIGVWPFMLGTVLALTIALGTLAYQAFKAARSNPIEALKYE